MPQMINKAETKTKHEYSGLIGDNKQVGNEAQVIIIRHKQRQRQEGKTKTGQSTENQLSK